MKIMRSAEDYLEAMLMMQEKHGYIRSIDIAAELNVTKPSVSYATKRLAENGYIVKGSDSTITLTDTGYEFDLRSIRPDNEFHGLMMRWLEIEKCDLIKIGSRQTDTVMMDMLFDAWNDINVGGKIDVNIKVHERGKDS